jgi:NAD(P)-dependent dehydrogenase (short-subunit alcohol dehydrogenase family)
MPTTLEMETTTEQTTGTSVEQMTAVGAKIAARVRNALAHPFDFKGKTALVIGGSTGIGRATALAFGQRSANVVVGGMNPKTSVVIDEIKKLGGDGFFQHCNATVETDVYAVVDAAVKKYGKIDCVFNNFGTLAKPALLTDTPVSELDRCIAVDLRGLYVAMQAEIKAMLKTGGGAIVNCGSVASLIADPMMSAYVACKHGVAGLTKAAAIEYVKQGIRINCLAPGFTRTPMTEPWVQDAWFRKMFFECENALSQTGRYAEPEEMAGAVLFLCSDLATFVNGHTLVVDGGQIVH